MKKKFLALITAGLIAVMALALAGCGSEATDDASEDSTEAASSDVTLRFGTGGESGTYYAFGGVIAQHATNNAGISITALSSDGSKANVLDIQDGNVELGFCQSDVEAYAYNGTSVFEDSGAVDCFSTVACLYQEQVQIVTCDPDIKTIADLKGKTVSVGAAGSGTYFNAVDILGAYGLTIDDINPTYQGFGDSTDSLKNGQIDAAFVVAGAPTTSIVDLSTSKQAYLVSLDAEHQAALLESSPYYKAATIPAGTYDGIDEDIITVSVGAVIIAADSVSEDAIYALCADIFDNAASLTDSHAKYAEVSIEEGASVVSAPYHPGAAKYFAEQGFEVATK